MTTRYMLDTNIVSQLLREHPNVLARVLATPMEALCISSITEGELLFGLANNPTNLKLNKPCKSYFVALTLYRGTARLLVNMGNYVQICKNKEKASVTLTCSLLPTQYLLTQSW